uniref:40S ribosomal protein S27 n=1 Tax=Propithecus coquereli TaxID=379532 RepID=A0A2K6EXV9_PROCO
MPLARDLLHPSLEEEKKKHKKKRLVQSPNSYFMDVKCPGCYKITTVFSHAQTVVLCVGCSTVLLHMYLELLYPLYELTTLSLYNDILCLFL